MALPLLPAPLANGVTAVLDLVQNGDASGLVAMLPREGLPYRVASAVLALRGGDATALLALLPAELQPAAQALWSALQSRDVAPLLSVALLPQSMQSAVAAVQDALREPADFSALRALVPAASSAAADTAAAAGDVNALINLLLSDAQQAAAAASGALALLRGLSLCVDVSLQVVKGHSTSFAHRLACGSGLCCDRRRAAHLAGGAARFVEQRRQCQQSDALCSRGGSAGAEVGGCRSVLASGQRAGRGTSRRHGGQRRLHLTLRCAAAGALPRLGGGFGGGHARAAAAA